MCGGLPFQVLAVQTDKIDRVQHQRWEAAIAHRSRDDFTREWEQQPRTFDHDQRMQIFLRHVHNAEYAGIGQIEAEHHLAGIFRFAFDRKRHFVLIFGDIVGTDVDLNIDRRLLLLRCQRGRRVRIFERQILGILRQHVQLGRRGCLGRRAVAVGHGSLSWSVRGPILRLNPPPEVRNAFVGASGYHSPASFHKDDNRAQLAKTRPIDRFSAAYTEDAGRSGHEAAR